MKIICIKHPKYDVHSAPILSCKTCCNMFILSLKEENKHKHSNQVAK